MEVIRGIEERKRADIEIAGREGEYEDESIEREREEQENS